MTCLADPNRIFTDTGITSKWAEWNNGRRECLGEPVRNEAQDAVRAYRDNELEPKIRQCRGQTVDSGGVIAGADVSGNLPVAAFHNNTPASRPDATASGRGCPENLTIRSYLSGHCESAATETDAARTGGFPNPNIIGGQDIDNFILVTDRSDFLALRSTRNVVLQKQNPPDDGSLSLVLSTGRYINIEAEKTPPTRPENAVMGTEALDQLGVPPGPCPV
jgi:hypothetical protein